MLGRFPHLSKFAIRLLEIAGAGCASALVAFLLDNSRHPLPLPPAPPAPVVRLAPADAQLIETVHSESVALAEQLRTELVTRSAPPHTPQKPLKAAAPAAPSVPKRVSKPAPPPMQNAEIKERPVEVKVVPEVPYPAPPAQPSSTDTAEHRNTSDAGKQSSGWLAGLDTAADVPRPPMGVARFSSSAM